MTISSETRKAGPYTGNGLTTSFSFAFKVFTTADVLVVRTDLSLLETTLTLNTDYSVTLNSNQDANPGGTVTLPGALTTGFLLTLSSQVGALQATDLTNQGGFYPSVLNTALDKLTILVQQLKEQVSRSVKVDISSSITPATLTTYIVALYNNLANIITVSGNTTNINTVAGNTTNINTVAANNSNVTSVGGNIANVNSVATNATNINAVNANATNINTVAGNNANVTTVAGISGNVTTVAGLAAAVNTVSSNNANISTVAGISTSVSTVAGISGNVTSVATNATNVTNVATNIANVNLTGGSIANVNNVGGSIANINTNAANISNINLNAANITAIQSASSNATSAATSATAAASSATSASSSAAAASAAALGNEPVRHSVRPSLLLDFANTKQLDPRITFSRPTTATYYDNVTTALAEQNLFTYSQDFTNSVWIKSPASVVTANTVTAPDGTTTACTVTLSTTNGGFYGPVQGNVKASAYNVASVYLKAGTDSQITVFNNLSANAYGTSCVFDLTAGTAGTVTNYGGASGSIISITPAGNGWYRCSIAVLAGTITTPWYMQVFGITSGNTFYVWGAQYEQRSSVTAYTPTTTAAITNYIPVLQTAASGQARFDHNPTTGESLGLLIEQQSTNLMLYSNAFDNAYWTKAASTITTAANIAPDGTPTAQKLVEDTTTANHVVYNFTSQSVVSGTTYTISAYLKASERTWGYVSGFGSPLGTNNWAWFNLSTGVIGAVGSSATATITSVGNGWYRCTVTMTATSSGTAGAAVYSAIANGSTSYAGNGYSGIYLWGAQLEAGSFATSYIPTVASQVTRSNDSASMTGTSFSSWYNQGQGTLYSSFSSRAPTSSRGVAACLGYTLSTSGNDISLDAGSSGYLRAFIEVNSTATYSNLTLTSYLQNSTNKTAISYSPTFCSSSANGVSGGTGSSTTLPPINNLQIGANNNSSAGISSLLTGTISKIAYYSKALTSAELQGLTTI